MSSIAKDLDQHFQQEVQALLLRHTKVMMGIVEPADIILSMFTAGMGLLCSSIASAAGSAIAADNGKHEEIVDIMIGRAAEELATGRARILAKAHAHVSGGGKLMRRSLAAHALALTA